MISSNNECVFIRDWSDLTFHIIFDAWWASMNVGSKQPIAWNDSRHASSWRFYLDCAIEETSSPAILCIICNQVLRHPSEHGTSSMGKHLKPKAHIAKLNELTVSEVTELTSSTVDETALAILKREGSRGIPIVSLQRKFKFNIQVLSILTELTDKTLWTGSKGLSNSSISPRHRESLPHVTICFGSYCMEFDIKRWATTFIECIMKWVGVIVSQHPEQYLPEGIHTDSGCN